MKTFLSSIVVIAFFVIIGIGFIQGQKMQSEKVAEYATPENNNVENPNANAEQLCFIWNHESGDSMKLSMDIRGSEVIGEFYWLPFQKDKKTGIFRGTVLPREEGAEDRNVVAWWDATSEGVTQTEEIKINFGEGIAKVGWGAMRQRNDGVYIYNDPNNLSWEPNLQQTDCGDSAMD